MEPRTTIEHVAHEQLPRRKIWTRAEAVKLIDLFPGQRYELIEGELFDKIGQRPQHAYVVSILTAILSRLFPGLVRVQLPITLPEPPGAVSEPEPDIVLLRAQAGISEFFTRHPRPEEIALLIEVSDTTLRMDREIKARVYAQSGIAMYWIVDIQQRRVIMLRLPGTDEYNAVRICEEREQIMVEGNPIGVAELFGPTAPQ